MRENEKLHQLLQIRSEQVRSGAEILLEKTRDWQLIREYMNNRIGELQLTTDQERKLERYKFVYDQLSSGRYTKQQVINQLMNDKLGFNVSLKQAYEDIRYSNELFSSVININKQFELNTRYEIAKAAAAKCMEVFDFKSAATYEKVIKDYLTMFPDEEESQGLDFEGHTLEGVFDPQLLGAPEVNMMELLTAINAKRKVPIKTDMFEHLNFEEKKNEETDSL